MPDHLTALIAPGRKLISDAPKFFAERLAPGLLACLISLTDDSRS